MKTFCSVFIKKEDILDSKEGADLEELEQRIKELEEDIQLNSVLVRKMTSDVGKPRTDKTESIHLEYKHRYNVSDYFVTNVTRQVKGIRNSAKECLKRNIATCEQKVTQMEKKITGLQDQIKKAQKIKDSLIARSKAKKENQKLPPIANYFNSGIKFSANMDGSTSFTISRRHCSGKKKGYAPSVFENEYLFETLYLDPYIRNKKRQIRQIQGRIHNTKRRIKRLKRDLKNGKYHLCFGGKKLFRQRYEKGLDLSKWKAAFKRRRLREMLLVGRKDASQGNFLVRYDSKKHILTYLSTKKTKVVLPGVIFPYGQECVDMAVAVSETEKRNKKLPDGQKIPCWNRMPVTWSIQDCGNAFHVKCMIEVPENKYMNTDFSDGCVGVDKNYDHFAVSEINGYGQLVNHFVVPFKMEHMSSDQVTNNISEALETVFKFARDAKKPIVMEDIKDVKKNLMYGNSKANRKISEFAYDKMDALAENKSQKYGIAIRKVNPAYTSQIGKLKYMKRMGLSIHEAAAYAIARRGMSFKERVPKELRKFVPKKKARMHHWAQWNAISSTLIAIPTHVFYKNVPYCESKNITALKRQLTKLAV